jgi:arylsulfatase
MEKVLNMTNVQVSLLVGLLLAWPGQELSPAAMAAEPADSPRPNIVLLLGDDWRNDTLGCETPVVKTPHLDALAADGVRFTQARVTTSICCVSRASLFTGQYMSRHGIDRFGQRVADWSLTYPAQLQQAGYYTGFVGKYGVGQAKPSDFDFVRSYEGTHWIKQPDGSRIHITEQNLRDSLAFLDARAAEKPFCLSVSFFAPHAQDGAEEQYLPQPWSEPLYADAVIPTPATATPAHFEHLPPFLANDRNEGRVRWRRRFDTPEKYQTYLKNYYRLVSEVDHAVGKIIARLKADGLYENTLIVFTGDNGYFHGERGLADKWYPYEESLRVPLIVHDPRLSPRRRGITSDALALNIDIGPTLLAAAGIKPPTAMQGLPLQSTYRAEASQPPLRKEFYYEHPVILAADRIPRSEAVIQGNLRYHYWPDYDHEELFDLARDRRQERNLASDPAHTAVLDEMRQKLKQLRRAAK